MTRAQTPEISPPVAAVSGSRPAEQQLRIARRRRLTAAARARGRIRVSITLRDLEIMVAVMAIRLWARTSVVMW